MDEEQELIREFLIESNDNLARLDQEMVELERKPGDQHLLASVFRTIHTIKGTCGFLGFSRLEAVTHLGENILSQVRNGEQPLTPKLVSLVLEMVDAVRRVLATIEATGAEGTETHEDLCSRLNTACLKHQPSANQSATPDPSPPPPVLAVSAEQVIEPSVEIPAAQVLADDAETPAAQYVEFGPDSLPSASPAAKTPAAAQGDDNGQSRNSPVADSTIRVDVALLDKLMNLVGELVLARNQILQFSGAKEDAGFNATSQRLNLITTELQEGVMKTRMQPIGMVWNKLPRIVRDLASSCGKQISLEMDGAETELDKTIIEAIKDPLTHIVRNCCDHGIERPDIRERAGKPAKGTLSLRAFHEGGHVNIEISDDGAGIDVARVRARAIQRGLLTREQADRASERELVHLVFRPGFSTTEQVTSISGRGVGMDVVKTNIEKIGGVVDLVSRPGHGTTAKIKIPLTLAIIPGLVVTAAGERFVIPQGSLLELVRLEGEEAQKQIEWIHGTPVYRRRGNLLPLVYLERILACEPDEDSRQAVNIVVVQAEDRQFGMVVDTINDTQEIVVKPLGKQLKGLECYAGATIMGDGKIALILDVMGIAQMAGVVSEGQERSRAAASVDATRTERHSLLLFRCGDFERLAVPLTLVSRLEEFPQSKIERAAGRRVVQYRGQILPLVSLGPVLEPAALDTAGAQDPAQAIVFSDGERHVGIIVDQILDIVEEEIQVRRQASRLGLLGSAVVGQKVADFVDLPAVISSGGGWCEQKLPESGAATVLLADGSRFNCGVMKNYLEMAGYRVHEAASGEEAAEKLARERVDIVVASLDLAIPGGDLAGRLRKTQGCARLPVLYLANSPGEVRPPAESGLEDYQMKFDREAMLRSVERLVSALHGGPKTAGSTAEEVTRVA